MKVADAGEVEAFDLTHIPVNLNALQIFAGSLIGAMQGNKAVGGVATPPRDASAQEGQDNIAPQEDGAMGDFLAPALEGLRVVEHGDDGVGRDFVRVDVSSDVHRIIVWVGCCIARLKCGGVLNLRVTKVFDCKPASIKVGALLFKLARGIVDCNAERGSPHDDGADVRVLVGDAVGFHYGKRVSRGRR